MVKADRRGNIQELQYVEAPIAALILRHVKDGLEEAKWRAEFERFGEEQVRSTLDRGQFHEPKAQFARRWLGDEAAFRTPRNPRHSGAWQC
jgi:hypothetical protein